MIEQITAFFGHEDYSITSFYSKELDKTFHVWVDAEDQIIVPGGLETSWHPLFEFPDNLHRTVDIAVDNPFFLGHIVEPDKDS